MVIRAEESIPRPGLDAPAKPGEKRPSCCPAAGRRRIDLEVGEAADGLRADITDRGGEVAGPLTLDEQVPGLHVAVSADYFTASCGRGSVLINAASGQLLRFGGRGSAVVEPRPQRECPMALRATKVDESRLVPRTGRSPG